MNGSLDISQQEGETSIEGHQTNESDKSLPRGTHWFPPSVIDSVTGEQDIDEATPRTTSPHPIAAVESVVEEQAMESDSLIDNATTQHPHTDDNQEDTPSQDPVNESITEEQGIEPVREATPRTTSPPVEEPHIDDAGARELMLIDHSHSLEDYKLLEAIQSQNIGIHPDLLEAETPSVD